MCGTCSNTEGRNMCCFCCTSLRGTVYYMVTVHMIGTFYMFVRCLYAFFDPPKDGYPDLDINPMIVSQFPLLLAGYALTACVFSCFIYRAVDMDSVIQMKWSAGCFGVFQFIVILNHFVFTVMFVDILTKSWQAVMVGLLVGNFLITITYLCVLFLYGKKLHYNKFKRPKHVRNSFHNENESSNSTMENNANTANAVLTLRKEPNNTQQTQNRMNVNLLENHVSVTAIGTETTPTQQSPVMITATTLPRSTQTSPRAGPPTTPRVGTQTTPRVDTQTTPSIGSQTTPRSGPPPPRVMSQTMPRSGPPPSPKVVSQTTPSVGSQTTPTIGSQTTPSVGVQTTPRIGSQTMPRSEPRVGPPPSPPRVGSLTTRRVGPPATPRAGTQATFKIEKSLPVTILSGSTTSLSIPVPSKSPPLIRPTASPPSPPHVTITVSSPFTPSTPTTATFAPPTQISEECDIDELECASL